MHGCYSLSAANGRSLTGAEHVRMQATALGRYLLYLPDGTFLAAQDDGGVRPAAEPSPAITCSTSPATTTRETGAAASAAAGRRRL